MTNMILGLLVIDVVVVLNTIGNQPIYNKFDDDKEVDSQMVNSDQIQKDTLSFSLSVFENENLIEHVVPFVEINEYNLLLSNPVDIPFPNSIKGSLGQKYNGQFRKIFTAPICNEMCDIRELYQGNHGLINRHEITNMEHSNEAYFMEQKFNFLHQLETQHEIYVPVAAYLEIFISSSCAYLISCQYGLPFYDDFPLFNFLFIFYFIYFIEGMKEIQCMR